MAIQTLIVSLLVLLACLLSGAAAGDGLGLATAREIRREALLPNQSPQGRPLPLLAGWNAATLPNGYHPDVQIQLIEQGHHLLPWFHLDPPTGDAAVKSPLAYYRNALLRCAEWGLPITLIGSQWERLLTETPAFRQLPSSVNPNVVKADGAIMPMVSPFGSLAPWREVGRLWTATQTLRQLQFWYPKPPLVLFVSNNEHPKLTWQAAETDSRYPTRLGNQANRGEQNRRLLGEAWIERYRSLQQGMREGLSQPEWRARARFIGYDAFGGAAFGRWPGWLDYSLSIPNRIEPAPLAWDGASVSYYTHDWDPSTDYTVWSPQIEAMNWVFMLHEAHRLNPDFWFELSVWDGATGQAQDKRAFYAKQGQRYGPARYAGMAKFGLWLLRPRVLREYRGHQETLAKTQDYFLSLASAVDEIHAKPLLKRFWRAGQLVENRGYLHPYQQQIPPEYAQAPRWFLLDTDRDPPRPWDLPTAIPVFALALVTGKPSSREWLVYAFSPLQAIAGVTVILPDYRKIRLDASPGGAYYHIHESPPSVNAVR